MEAKDDKRWKEAFLCKGDGDCEYKHGKWQLGNKYACKSSKSLQNRTTMRPDLEALI